MDIQELYFITIPGSNGPGVGRLDPDDTKRIQVGKTHIMAGLHLEGLAFRAFPAFFFQLEGIDIPVGDVVEPYFIPDMMFDGEGVDPSAGSGVAGVKTGCWRLFCSLL